MLAQSKNVALLIGMITITLLLELDYMAVKGDVLDVELCVTSRKRVKDLSYQNLTQVPTNLPNDTQYLDISHNLIRRLNVAAFHRLSKLCFLKLTHCGLQDIAPGVFDHMPALRVLNISFNNLTTIPDISVKHLTSLYLAHNPYNNYHLPASFQNMTNLRVLSLGGEGDLSINLNDFVALTNISLRHLALGTGGAWQRYESGALGKLSVQKISLFVSFCGRFDMFGDVLRDVNATGAAALRFVTLFPSDCKVTSDPFLNIRTMPLLRNLTIENTWTNSSFLKQLLKNIWLSPLENFLLVNITYNEDTPDGFTFPTINHTISLHSLTFDDVLHYQYRYPIINISSEAISNLTYLKFSKTGMNILPCNLLSTLPALETLDLSDNLLSDLGFWWPSCQYTAVFPKLKQLFFSKNRFSSLSFISERTNEMKTLQVLDLSFNSIYLDRNCSWPAHLTELNLGNNNLGNNIFHYLSSYFEKIDLTKTGITAITEADLSRFPKLTHLKLSENSIRVIPALQNPLALVSLSVDQNTIASISEEVLEGLPRLQTLNAGGNPFVCSCDSYWFVKSLNKSLLLNWPQEYTCSAPPKFAGLQLSQYRTSRLTCEMWLQSVVVLLTLTIISAIVGVLFYRFDGMWYTKMLWVWIRVKRRGRKRANMMKNQSFSYHAFISYSHQDASWVDSKLVPSLEQAGFSLCVHERDFIPGEWIIDNIINCVESSYKTLFLLSEHFVRSEWCNYELFFAQHRAINIQEDSLVFILLEPIPTDCLPKKFLRLRSLLRQQTYLEWPKDERKQQVFWASLKSMLHMADKSVVLKNVALSLSDTVALVTNQV